MSTTTKRESGVEQGSARLRRPFQVQEHVEWQRERVEKCLAKGHGGDDDDCGDSGNAVDVVVVVDDAAG